MKIVVKSGFVFFENRQGTREVKRSAQPAADSFQDVADSGGVRIRSEPILLAHAIQNDGGMRREFRQASLKVAVKVINELPKGAVGIHRPVSREKMIEVDVGENASEAAVRWREPQHAGFPSRMRVGEGINLAVTADALLVALRQWAQLGRGYKIGEKIAHAKLRRRFR